MSLTGATGKKRILLIIGGGIAAYKSLELIRRLREKGYFVRAVMTEAAQEFITKLSAESLTGSRVYSDLFALTEDAEMGHIELSRDADLLVVAPATADLVAKMAHGLANDLASTLLLATDKKILAAPAMNVRMWLHPATKRNLEILQNDGVTFVGPEQGEMACGEFGPGRMSEPPAIVAAIEQMLAGDTSTPFPAGDPADTPGENVLAGDTSTPFPAGDPADTPGENVLAGRRIIVTSGPTREPIDPVRYISNRSSGRQGHAIAAAAAAAAAKVVLVSGPGALADPKGVTAIHVETATEMLRAVEGALPADIFIGVAAVADWRCADVSSAKLKKAGKGSVSLALVENPDILATIGRRPSGRPTLVVGFAAETENLVENAQAKLAAKNCDVVVANFLGKGSRVLGGEMNKVIVLTREGQEAWPSMTKEEVARRLVALLARMLAANCR